METIEQRIQRISFFLIRNGVVQLQVATKFQLEFVGRPFSKIFRILSIFCNTFEWFWSRRIVLWLQIDWWLYWLLGSLINFAHQDCSIPACPWRETGAVCTELVLWKEACSSLFMFLLVMLFWSIWSEVCQSKRGGKEKVQRYFIRCITYIISRW